MYRVLDSSLDLIVELNLPFGLVPELMKNRLVSLPPGFCHNHCTLFTVVEKLHLRVELVPCWRLRNEGLSSTFIPLTLLRKKTANTNGVTGD